MKDGVEAAGFNEAGARTPQKAGVPDTLQMGNDSFNEAGARTPQKARDRRPPAAPPPPRLQ